MGKEMGREENVKIFQDTERVAKTNKRLIESVKKPLGTEIIGPVTVPSGFL